MGWAGESYCWSVIGSGDGCVSWGCSVSGPMSVGSGEGTSTYLRSEVRELRDDAIDKVEYDLKRNYVRTFHWYV